ncbi:DUF3027 family protein [Leucobacter luti]|uniref:DUF3027 domain-containing protein n=1 Tax=Leucobacter luti TaxID=340320 RepID=UPI00104E7787|nr:DUF3027 domain-containing protein [Leucobacter luti]MCW2288770.1 hypothetical protein [Leucobacter luti]TCK45078.1 DUF3027 family protein [Leucobacter luti]
MSEARPEAVAAEVDAAEAPPAELPTAEPAHVEAPAADETPVTPDPVLLQAREQARAALEEITEADTIGAEDGFEAHDAHVLTLFFDCRMAGYPGWRWAATLARVDADAPVTVLEVELLPGADAVTAPEWVPWSERLAQYRETQAKQAAEGTSESDDDSVELAELREDDAAEDDLLDNDFSDFDDEIDGVDVDDLDDDEDDADDSDASDGSDDSEDDEAEDLTDESDDTELFDDSDDEEE